MRATNEQAITFTDKNAKRVHHPHDDAIVNTLLIADYMTRRVLVDNGSSTDILYYPAFRDDNFAPPYLTCPSPFRPVRVFPAITKVMGQEWDRILALHHETGWG